MLPFLFYSSQISTTRFHCNRICRNWALHKVCNTTRAQYCEGCDRVNGKAPRGSIPMDTNSSCDFCKNRRTNQFRHLLYIIKFNAPQLSATTSSNIVLTYLGLEILVHDLALNEKIRIFLYLRSSKKDFSGSDFRICDFHVFKFPKFLSVV